MSDTLIPDRGGFKVSIQSDADGTASLVNVDVMLAGGGLFVGGSLLLDTRDAEALAGQLLDCVEAIKMARVAP